MDLWAVSTFEEVVPGHRHDGPGGLHGREDLPQPEHHLHHPPLVLGLLTTRRMEIMWPAARGPHLDLPRPRRAEHGQGVGGADGAAGVAAGGHQAEAGRQTAAQLWRGRGSVNEVNMNED